MKLKIGCGQLCRVKNRWFVCGENWLCVYCGMLLSAVVAVAAVILIVVF